MIFKGRQKIVAPYNQEDLLEFSNVVDMVRLAMDVHNSNRSQIRYLKNYWKGEQPILHRTKDVRDEIMNNVVINHARRATRTITGYFLGNPIQYIHAGGDYKVNVELLNKLLTYEGKHTVDNEIAVNQSVVGTGYKIIFTDNEELDEVPFEQRSLDPMNTFVVYTNDVAEYPLAGVTYHSIVTESGMEDEYMYYVYTKKGLWKFKTHSMGRIDNRSIGEFTPYSIGNVPIIEYPNNPERMGDWEFTIDLQNAINILQSNRLDDVEQIVQALLVFVNADIDSDKYTEMREKGVVVLRSIGGERSSVSAIKNELDQDGMHIFAEELTQLFDSLVGIPSRDHTASGGDTGQATELRDGWADLEIVARNKQSQFERSELKTLKVILTILQNKGIMNLPLLQVDIKFSRNKNHNLLVKSQSYVNLITTRTVSPADALTIVDLVSDSNEYATRGEAYWNEKSQAVEDVVIENQEGVISQGEDE